MITNVYSGASTPDAAIKYWIHEHEGAFYVCSKAAMPIPSVSQGGLYWHFPDVETRKQIKSWSEAKAQVSRQVYIEGLMSGVGEFAACQRLIRAMNLGFEWPGSLSTTKEL